MCIAAKVVFDALSTRLYALHTLQHKHAFKLYAQVHCYLCRVFTCALPHDLPYELHKLVLDAMSA